MFTKGMLENLKNILNKVFSLQTLCSKTIISNGLKYNNSPLWINDIVDKDYYTGKNILIYLITLSIQAYPMIKFNKDFSLSCKIYGCPDINLNKYENFKLDNDLQNIFYKNYKLYKYNIERFFIGKHDYESMMSDYGEFDSLLLNSFDDIDFEELYNTYKVLNIKCKNSDENTENFITDKYYFMSELYDTLLNIDLILTSTECKQILLFLNSITIDVNDYNFLGFLYNISIVSQNENTILVFTKFI